MGPFPYQKPHKVEYTVVTYHVNVDAVRVECVIYLQNNTQGCQIHSGPTGILSLQPTWTPPGENTARIAGAFTGNWTFEIDSLWIFMIDIRRSLSLQVGYVVVPALPVAVVYQPPSPDALSSFSISQSTGVGIIDMSCDGVGIPGPYSFGGLDTAISVLDDISMAAKILPYGDIISGVAKALSFILGLFRDKPGEQAQYSVQVNTEERLEFISTTEFIYGSDATLGWGRGDNIVYLHDMTSAYYCYNGQAKFIPLGYRALTPDNSVTANLEPGASAPPDLLPPVRDALRALDPCAAGGNPSSIPDRFQLVGGFTHPSDHTLKELTTSFTVQTNTSVVPQTFKVDLDGRLLSITYGDGTSRLSSRTSTITVQATGPCSFLIYYDRFFGTYAFEKKTAFSSIAYKQRLLDGYRLPLPGRKITLEQDGCKFVTWTDSNGGYSFEFPSLKPGSATIFHESHNMPPIEVTLQGTVRPPIK